MFTCHLDKCPKQFSVHKIKNKTKQTHRLHPLVKLNKGQYSKKQNTSVNETPYFKKSSNSNDGLHIRGGKREFTFFFTVHFILKLP